MAVRVARREKEVKDSRLRLLTQDGIIEPIRSPQTANALGDYQPNLHDPFGGIVLVDQAEVYCLFDLSAPGVDLNIPGRSNSRGRDSYAASFQKT
jgi:hypothetical protein